MLPPQPQLSLPTPKNVHLPRLLAAVLPAQVRHRASRRRRSCTRPTRSSPATVPLPTLPQMYGSAAELLAQVHELVRAEVVVLRHAAPVRVDHRRALLARADAVPPVVLVGEAAARPAQDRDLQVAAAPRPRRCGCRACWGSANPRRPRSRRRCSGPDARRNGRRCTLSMVTVPKSAPMITRFTMAPPFPFRQKLQHKATRTKLKACGGSCQIAYIRIRGSAA